MSKPTFALSVTQVQFLFFVYLFIYKFILRRYSQGIAEM